MRPQMSVREAAAVIGMSPPSVIKRIEDGRIVASNYGTTEKPWYKIRREALEGFLRNTRI